MSAPQQHAPQRVPRTSFFSIRTPFVDCRVIRVGFPSGFASIDVDVRESHIRHEKYIMTNILEGKESYDLLCRTGVKNTTRCKYI